MCRCDTSVKQFEHAGLKVRIEHDEDAEDPRKGFDNHLGIMVCSHRRYDLGDKDHGIDFNAHNSWAEVEATLRKTKDAALVLPLFLYDHSGLRLKVGSFQGHLPQGHAEFDSGQVGFIYVSRAALREEYSVKRLSKKTLATAEKVLRSEVDEYDDYLSGQVYGYVIEDAEGEHLDSCWGFYGLEYCEQEAKSAAESAAAARKKKSEGKDE